MTHRIPLKKVFAEVQTFITNVLEHAVETNRNDLITQALKIQNLLMDNVQRRVHYTDDEKQRIMKEYSELRLDGLTAADAAEQLGVPYASITRWIGELNG